jgi:hypothetical protein
MMKIWAIHSIAPLFYTKALHSRADFLHSVAKNRIDGHHTIRQDLQALARAADFWGSPQESKNAISVDLSALPFPGLVAWKTSFRPTPEKEYRQTDRRL